MRLAFALAAVPLWGGLSPAEGPPHLAQVLACHREVYALAQFEGRLFAATSGGVVDTQALTVYRSVGGILPGRVRRLEVADGRLIATDYEGRRAALAGSKWVGLQGKASKVDLPAVAAPQGSGGAFLSAVFGSGDQVLYSFWGAKWIYRRQGAEWVKDMPRPSAEGDYALLQVGKALIAGTSDGLRSWNGTAWNRIELPEGLPISRVHGLARLATGALVVGGPQGLCIREAGRWRSLSHEPVRRIVGSRDAVWVLYGSGAVDKLEANRSRLLADVLYGAVKRPWCSALALEGEGVLFGMNGGWTERTKDGQREHYPAELAGDVVTSFAGVGHARYVGTQKNGLFAVNGDRMRRIGPAQGLPDAWITALQAHDGTLFVGTSGSGLWAFRGERPEPVPCPTKMVSALAVWAGSLVLGGSNGAWMRSGREWIPLDTDGQETCALALDRSSLWVLTPTGAYRFAGG